MHAFPGVLKIVFCRTTTRNEFELDRAERFYRLIFLDEVGDIQFKSARVLHCFSFRSFGRPQLEIVQGRFAAIHHLHFRLGDRGQLQLQIQFGKGNIWHGSFVHVGLP
jgi:hypothetical protein